MPPLSPVVCCLDKITNGEGGAGVMPSTRLTSGRCTYWGPVAADFI
jgi:hypothetical protein